LGHLVVYTPDGQPRVFGDPHAAPGARLELRDWRACGRDFYAKAISALADAWRAFWVEQRPIWRLVARPHPQRTRADMHAYVRAGSRSVW